MTGGVFRAVDVMNAIGERSSGPILAAADANDERLALD